MRFYSLAVLAGLMMMAPAYGMWPFEKICEDGTQVNFQLSDDHSIMTVEVRGHGDYPDRRYSAHNVAEKEYGGSTPYILCSKRVVSFAGTMAELPFLMIENAYKHKLHVKIDKMCGSGDPLAIHIWETKPLHYKKILACKFR